MLNYLTNETIKKNVFVVVETKLLLLMASSVLTFHGSTTAQQTFFELLYLCVKYEQKPKIKGVEKCRWLRDLVYALSPNQAMWTILHTENEYINYSAGNCAW